VQPLIYKIFNSQRLTIKFEIENNTESMRENFSYNSGDQMPHISSPDFLNRKLLFKLPGDYSDQPTHTIEFLNYLLGQNIRFGTNSSIRGVERDSFFIPEFIKKIFKTISFVFQNPAVSILKGKILNKVNIMNMCGSKDKILN